MRAIQAQRGVNMGHMTYLLTQDETGTEHVQQLNAAEFAQEFTVSEQNQLEGGETVVRLTRLGALRFTNMVVAAQIMRAKASRQANQP